MKLTPLYTTLLGLLTTASATTLDNTLIPTNNTNPVHGAAIGPGWTADPPSCRVCSDFINDCSDDCKGGDRQSCEDYCGCEGLLSKKCQASDCRHMFRNWNRDYINADFCPQGGDMRA